MGFITATVVSALAGSFAFLPDQERRNYRFFQEHNVRPRYVWFTRQVPWIAILSVSAIVVVLLSVYPLYHALMRALDRFTQSWQSGHGSFFSEDVNVSFALWMLAPAWIATSYAAGQLCSMLIRSGLLAAVAGVLLSGVLCFWILLVLPMMHLSWLWAVAPIPLVLLWATWLRAPDWVRENDSWWARARIIAATIIPAIVMVASVAVYRVWQVPDVAWSPRGQWAWELSPEDRETVELFRRAGEHYRSVVWYQLEDEQESSTDDAAEEKENWPSLRTPTESARRWLADNAESIALLTEASGRPMSWLFDPYASLSSAEIRRHDALGRLLTYHAQDLESRGRLDERSTPTLSP